MDVDILIIPVHRPIMSDVPGIHDVDVPPVSVRMTMIDGVPDVPNVNVPADFIPMPMVDDAPINNVANHNQKQSPLFPLSNQLPQTETTTSSTYQSPNHADVLMVDSSSDHPMSPDTDVILTLSMFRLA